MTRGHSIAELRQRLARLVRNAESGDSVQITRRGKPVAILMGLRKYQQLVSRCGDFGAAYGDFARDTAVATLDIDPDEVFASARDRTPGRLVDL